MGTSMSNADEADRGYRVRGARRHCCVVPRSLVGSAGLHIIYVTTCFPENMPTYARIRSR